MHGWLDDTTPGELEGATRAKETRVVVRRPSIRKFWRARDPEEALVVTRVVMLDVWLINRSKRWLVKGGMVVVRVAAAGAVKLLKRVILKVNEWH